MILFTFVLAYYFSALLAVSGLSKVESPQHFATTLQQQRIVPTWSIQALSRTLPWLEVLLAFLLLAGVFPVLIAALVGVLFLIFLAIKLCLFLKGYSQDCGCYGQAHRQRIDGINIVVSLLLTLLAALQLWLVDQVSLVAWFWRLPGCVLFLIMAAFLLRKIMSRRRLRPTVTYLAAPDVGGLALGEQAPSFVALDQHATRFNLDDFRGHPLLLLFVSPGCSACPAALEALHQVVHKESQFMALIVGSPDSERNRLYASERNIAEPLLTPEPAVIEQQYQVRGFPLLFVIDTFGSIRAKGVIATPEHVYTLLQSTQMHMFV